MSLRKAGLYCGIVGPALWLALIAIAGALRPDFNHVTHYISELGERGSSTETLMRGAGFEFTGFLYLCFAAALLATVRQGWLAAIACLLIALDGTGRMGAGIFPCDPGCVRVTTTQDLHRLFATIGFSAGIFAAILWGVLFRKLAALRSISWFSMVCGVVALISLVLMSSQREPLVARGLLEHLATGILSIWLCVFAFRLAREE